jgi:S1-C subfamily serine protease
MDEQREPDEQEPQPMLPWPDPWTPQSQPAPPPEAAHARGARRWTVGTSAATVAVLGAAVALSFGLGHATASRGGATSASGSTSTGTGAVVPSAGTGTEGGTGDGTGLGRMNGSGRQRFYGYGSGSGGSQVTPPGSGSGTSVGTSGQGSSTTAQQVGVVDIVVTLGYQQAEAAGTGMILSSTGEVLTNNHVVDGATSIKVTVVTTGKTYSASVVGVDPTDDVAVIQLKGASGLKTVQVSSTAATKGLSVVGVGNAGGAGGTPSAASGKVVDLDQAITAQDEGGGNAERLTGLIESDAAIQSGDSGGPLFNSDDKVVGMDTAISSGGDAVQAYAIPIAHALAIAKQIEAGQASSTIKIGATGFLGVELVDTTGGATIQSVVSGSPAETAGLQAGDVITAVGSTKISAADKLTTAIGALSPGDHVTLHWTDTLGQTHQATVTLVAGPAK